MLRVPALLDDEGFALALLDQEGVLVHPGSAFGLPASGWLVTSLLPEPHLFTDGIGALVRLAARLVARLSE